MLKKLPGYECLSNLENIYSDFLLGQQTVMAVLGKPSCGKRWWFEHTAAKMNVDYVSSATVYEDKEAFISWLGKNKENVIFSYERTSTEFSKKNELEIILDLCEGRTVIEPEKYGINSVEPFEFSGKYLIVDDAYTKRSPKLENVLSGYEFTFGINDLIKYVDENKSSIADTYKIAEGNIDKVLGFYTLLSSKKILPLEKVNNSFDFSVSMVVQLARMIDRGQENPFKFFPLYEFEDIKV